MTVGYLTKERQMLRDLAREFTEQEVLPVANELDPVQGVIPDDLVRKLGDMGYFGIVIPEEYGGAGLGLRVLPHRRGAVAGLDECGEPDRSRQRGFTGRSRERETSGARRSGGWRGATIWAPRDVGARFRLGPRVGTTLTRVSRRYARSIIDVDKAFHWENKS